MNAPDLLRQLDHGARAFAVDESESVFLEKPNAQVQLKIETARMLAKAAELAARETVLFLDAESRIYDAVDVSRPESLSEMDFSLVQAMVLPPHLGRRMGNWARTAMRGDGMWTLKFQRRASGDDLVIATLGKGVLEPWFSNIRSIASFKVPILLMSHTTGYVNSVAGLHESLRKTLSTSRVHIHISNVTRALELLDKAHGVEKHLTRDLSPSNVSTIGEPGVTVGVLAGAAKLEEAAKNIDAITSEFVASAKSIEAEQKKPAQRVFDNAIAIRKELLKEVEFVNARKWADARGAAESKNPSAALGKRKKNGEIFSVSMGRKHLYPAFQFKENGSPVDVIGKVLKVVPKASQGWPLVSWFSARNRLLDGRTPAEVVESDPKKVLAAAKRFYSRD